MSGIIPTPSHGVIIGALPLADAPNRKSMRIPVDTLENGWESYELKDILGRLHTLENRKLEEWMPVGHIYVQLPSQPEPSVLYPRATWSNISSSYTGSFFRVEGGNAAPYGTWQDESLPNITGSFQTIGLGQQNYTYSGGAIAHQKSDIHSSITQDNFQGGNPRFDFSANRSHGAYGRRNEVAPRNYAIRIWRKTGNISSYSSFALINDEGVYQDTIELGKDEAGFIGYNPHIHIDTPPVKSLISRHAKSSHEVLIYHRERATWESVEDHRGRTAYLRDGSGSRIIHQLGDTLAEGETWDAPEPTTLEA